MTRAALWKSVAVGLIAGMVGVNVVGANEPPPAPAGPRIRVTAPTVSGKRLVGALVRMNDTTLTLRRENGKGVLEVPRSAVTRIEVSRRPSRRGRGVGIGTLVGLGAAVAIGLGAGENCTRNEWLCFDKSTMALASAVLTVPAGALIGLAVAPGERWSTTTPDRLRLAVAPAGGRGVRLALAVRF